MTIEEKLADIGHWILETLQQEWSAPDPWEIQDRAEELGLVQRYEKTDCFHQGEGHSLACTGDCNGEECQSEAEPGDPCLHNAPDYVAWKKSRVIKG